jgi:signal transduction histidine kinase
MIRLHSSLGSRLFLAATVFIAIALISVAAVTDVILDRFVHRQIDQQLDAQIASLSASLKIGPDGSLSLLHAADGPPFDRPFSGWYWKIEQAHASLRSASLQGRDLHIPPNPQHAPPPASSLDDAASRMTPPAPADGPGPRDEGLHFRVKIFRIGPRDITITATAPDDAFIGPLHQAMTAVLLALGLAAVVLIAAMYFQVRLGLSPLRKLRSSVADIRAGRAERIPADQPSEIAPLAEELNKLIGENAESLVRARRHVANLAHGLKTPLANLGVALQAPDRDSSEELLALVTLMDRRIRHHLSRARVAALDGPARGRTLLAERISDLVAVLSKIHADRRVTARIEADALLAVACEPQDMDEMLGNLIDNAFKWAKQQVRIQARPENGAVTVSVEDDGIGLTENAIPEVLRPGKRLDENAPGYGFGLPITRELAELYGGTLTLGRSDLGGMSARLVLPAARL